MKKFIALALSIMMVMSLVAVPVMAEDAVVEDTTGSSGETTPTIVTPASLGVEPAVWIKASDPGFATYNETVNPNAFGSFKNHGTGSNIGGRYSGQYGSDTTLGVFVYQASTAPNTLEAWEGFKLAAHSPLKSDTGKIYHNDPAVTFNTGASGKFTNKLIRADSVRFKLPDCSTTSAGVVYLFGGTNAASYPATSASAGNSLRLRRGGAYSYHLTSGTGNEVAFIPDGTLEADKWYRAERILDTRIDNGTSDVADTQNWARFIIYDDATNAVVGDSGWRHVASVAKASVAANAAYPMTNIGFGAGKFDAGTFVYIDDIKSWALDVPTDNAIIGAPEDPGHKWLTYPIVPSNFAEEWKAIKGNTWSYNNAVIQNAYAKHGNAVKNSKYIYFQEDFMIPENVTNNYGFGLIDIVDATSYNSNVVDYGSYTGGYTGGNGVLQVKKDSSGASILKVKEWDGTSLPNGATAAGYYINDVKLKGGSDFALTLTPGEWYSATLKIDQSEFEGKLSSMPAGDRETEYKAALVGDDGELTLMTADQTTKATVIIKDSQGNTYETAEFTWKSPLNYTRATSLSSLLLIDGRKPNNSSNMPGGYKVSVDNVKIVLSDSDIDADDAYLVYEEGFDNQVTGNNFTQVGNSYPFSTSCSQFAIVEADNDNIVGLPSQVEVTLGQDINPTTLAQTVKLYKGGVDISDQISASYDADTNKLLLTLSALEPITTYDVKIARNAATAEANIFSVLPGDTGAELAYSFTTGYADTGELIFTPEFGLDYGDQGYYNIEDEDIGGTYAFGDIIYGYNSTLTSNNASPMSYVAIAAVYDTEGKMEDMMSEVGTIAGNGTTINLFTAEDAYIAPVVTVTGEDEYETKIVKAFIWNTWRLMKPIANHYCYPADTAE